MSSGYVYALKNESMPGLIKIGKSINGGRMRAGQLYTTGVPLPFELVFEMFFQDCDTAELLVHEALQHDRCNQGREFFKVEEHEAVLAIVSVISSEYDIHVGDACDSECVESIRTLAYQANISILSTCVAMNRASRTDGSYTQSLKKELEKEIKMQGVA